jgi:ABC-type transport system involved in Fe-S cluster assembly fused permease/ATPase subunit
MPRRVHHPSPLALTSALLVGAGELDEAAAALRDAGLTHTAGRLARVRTILIQEYEIMSLFANAIHQLQQQLTDANAARDKAQADADKNAADAKSLADLRAGGFIADQSDVDAANAVLNPAPADTTAGGTGGDTTTGATGGDTVAGGNAPA